jgi:hypothetical protein
VLAFYAGTLLVPAFGIALLIHGRRERRLGKESGAGNAFRVGLTALASVWLALLAPAILSTCGANLVTNVPKSLTTLLIDAGLIYLFRSRSRRRRLMTEERLRVQQFNDEVNRQGV